MIADSVPWKEELSKIAGRLEKRAEQRRWSERARFLIERDVMVGFYAVRKLFDTPGKISQECQDYRLNVTAYPIRDKGPDFWDAYNFSKFYDFEARSETSLSLREACNQIIHSRVFATVYQEGSEGLAGILVASDQKSKKKLFLITLEEIINALREVFEDEVLAFGWRRDGDGVRSYYSSRIANFTPPGQAGVSSLAADNSRPVQ
ncbi:hypothetical protein [Nocardia sp. NPDC050412]|uniref:hypothetical protein n=1 Tax=Nocardia sp. NPDC050412 TaxID=3364320 RepID=UPI00378C0C73